MGRELPKTSADKSGSHRQPAGAPHGGVPPRHRPHPPQPWSLVASILLFGPLATWSAPLAARHPSALPGPCRPGPGRLLPACRPPAPGCLPSSDCPRHPPPRIAATSGPSRHPVPARPPPEFRPSPGSRSPRGPGLQPQSPPAARVHLPACRRHFAPAAITERARTLAAANAGHPGRRAG